MCPGLPVAIEADPALSVSKAAPMATPTCRKSKRGLTEAEYRPRPQQKSIASVPQGDRLEWAKRVLGEGLPEEVDPFRSSAARGIAQRAVTARVAG